ncbi:MAG TPA: hypothetical protein VHN37_02570 [Actinomycetota bacterium]|nr:hypothetical protein [Actinomycetota bacterium]
MDAGLGIAGIATVALAAGHTFVGVRWILPRLAPEDLPPTPFGSRSTTRDMIRVAWFVVTIFAASTGGILTTLAWDPEVDARTVVLRWLAGMWLVAALMAFWTVRRRPGAIVRLPVPWVWVGIAALCWSAST